MSIEAVNYKYDNQVGIFQRNVKKLQKFLPTWWHGNWDCILSTAIGVVGGGG